MTTASERSVKHLRTFSTPPIFLAPLVFLLLTLSACTNHSTAPTSSTPFITNPGIQLTQSGESANIAWLSSGNDIAYSALTLHGSMNVGGVKSVNLSSKAVTVLDPTYASSTNLHPQVIRCFTLL